MHHLFVIINHVETNIYRKWSEEGLEPDISQLFAIARRAHLLNEKWEKSPIFQEITDKNPYLSVF
jgi:hypothetical protein